MAATRTIQTTIALAGEAAFRREMESVNRNLRTLKAEVKAAESAFQSQGKSVDTLKNYQSKLQEVYAQTKVKVEALTQAVVDAADKYGENSKEADRQREALAKAKAEMSGYEAALHKTSEELEKAEKEEKDAAEGIREVGQSSEKAAAQLNAMDVALGNMLANLGQKGVELLKEIGQIGIEYNAQIESYTMAMTTALGSAEAAAAAIANIKLDAAVTPYSVDALVRANQLLIAAGESAGGARATIMALSDAVSATGGGNDELTRMAQNLQQIRNVGKASAMDIKQFQMAGIDVYGILADYTGMAIEDVSQLTVTYELLSAALQAAAQEGGRYFGANAAQAATLYGQLSTLQDNAKAKLGEAFQSASNVLTTKLLPAVNDFITGLDMEEVLEDFDRFLDIALAVGGAIGTILVMKKINSFLDGWKEAAKAIRTAEGALTAAGIQQGVVNGQVSLGSLLYAVLSGEIDKATAKQLALNAAQAAAPYAIVAAGVAAITLGLRALNREAQATAQAFTADAMTSDDLDAVSAKLDETREKYLELKAAFEDPWNENGPNYFEVQAWGDAVEELEQHYADLQQAAEAAAQAEAEHQAYLESTAGKIETITGELEELRKAYDEAYQSAYDSLIGQFDLFQQAEPVVAKSTDEIIAALESQADYFNRYADNLDMLHTLTAEGIGLNADLVEGLTDGSEKSVVAAETLVKGYRDALAQGEDAAQAYVESINNAYQAQQEAADRAAREMVELQADQIAQMEAQLAELEEKLAQEGEAAGRMAVLRMTDALSSGSVLIADTMYQSGVEALNWFQAGLNSGSLTLPTIDFVGSGRGRVDGSHALGLDYVPYDGYIAELHKREMIVPAPKADELRAGRFGSKTEINIYPQDMSESTLDYVYQRFVQRAGDAI